VAKSAALDCNRYRPFLQHKGDINFCVGCMDGIFKNHKQSMFNKGLDKKDLFIRRLGRKLLDL